jgi:hypothetical protein
MADRYDDRYRDRWSDRDRERNQEWDERHEQSRNRGWEGSSLSNYGDRDRRERENYPSNRYGNDDNRGGPHDFRSERERGGFVSRTPYMGEAPHEGRGGGYAQGNEGGYGSSPTGATWGASEAARHRIGGLTDSAAESARRVQQRAAAQGIHAGRGPKNYQRSDERITDEICERLTRDPEVDATNIEIAVQSGLVTLSGIVGDRQSKRAAEDLANDVWGVKDVQNQIKVQRADLLTSTDANQSSGQNTAPVVGHSAAATTKH